MLTLIGMAKLLAATGCAIFIVNCIDYWLIHH